MKFTKTVAQALANKTRQNLSAIRNKQIKEFVLPKKEEKSIKELIAHYFAVKEEYNKVLDKLSEKGAGIYHQCGDTPEVLFEKYVRVVAEKTIPKVPSCNTLTDDFLIESLDAENAEELIAKVTAKYTE